MNNRLAPDRLTTHSHRPVFLISFLLIIVVALRRRYDLAGSFSLGHLLFLLGLFAVLFVSASLLSRRIKSYHLIYFSLQLFMVQILGLFQEYQDTWALLYIALGFQVAGCCSRKEAGVWFSLFAASLLVTLSAEFGLISGPGRALAYAVIGVILISYDIQYAQHEDALAESQMLVAELQEAHQKLIAYAAQAEKLAAMQQRNRMLQELYDSVGQQIFAIQLAAETTRRMLVKDPRRAAEQIDNLQVQSQSALSQMRQLIGQWRPG
jgi:signal transduction histidine kinase